MKSTNNLTVTIKKYILLFLIYTSLFFIINAIHFHIIGADVILYSLFIDLGISTILMVFFVYLYREYFVLNNIIGLFFFLMSVFQSLIIYSIFIPTAVDRSLSVYLLHQLDEHDGALTLAEFDKAASITYFIDMDVVQVRINEQLATGSISMVGNNVVLTDKGKSMNFLFMLVKTYLLPDRS